VSELAELGYLHCGPRLGAEAQVGRRRHNRRLRSTRTTPPASRPDGEVLVAMVVSADSREDADYVPRLPQGRLNVISNDKGWLAHACLGEQGER